MIEGYPPLILFRLKQDILSPLQCLLIEHFSNAIRILNCCFGSICTQSCVSFSVFSFFLPFSLCLYVSPTYTEIILLVVQVINYLFTKYNMKSERTHRIMANCITQSIIIIKVSHKKLKITT